MTHSDRPVSVVNSHERVVKVPKVADAVLHRNNRQTTLLPPVHLKSRKQQELKYELVLTYQKSADEETTGRVRC